MYCKIKGKEGIFKIRSDNYDDPIDENKRTSVHVHKADFDFDPEWDTLTKYPADQIEKVYDNKYEAIEAGEIVIVCE